MSFRLSLNLKARDNFAFVDLEAPLVLNLSNPSGTSTRITNSILRGLIGKTLIDLDGVIDLTTGKFKVAKEVAKEMPSKEAVNVDKKAEVVTKDEEHVEEPKEPVEEPKEKVVEPVPEVHKESKADTSKPKVKTRNKK